jgi:hypothetical protein
MAGIISSLGNPPMVPVIPGGGAELTGNNTTDRQLVTATISNTINIRSTNRHRQYQRQSTTSALDWSNKRNLNRTNTSSQSTSDPQDTNRDNINNTILQIEQEADEAYYRRWHVPRLGNMTECRPDGVYRFMGAQLNSISSAATRDKKVADIDRIMETWEVQGGCFQEI